MSYLSAYTTMDKSHWGDGPWQREPDKVHFVDEATDLDCLIVRNRLGALCGYVAVEPGHPWHGLDCDATARGSAPDLEGRPAEGYGMRGLLAVLSDDLDGFAETVAGRVEVHGGLTYAGSCQRSEQLPAEALICHTPRPGRPHDVWWLGFDCAHLHDFVPGTRARERAMGFDSPVYERDEVYRDIYYVLDECARLAAQVAAAKEDAS